VVGLFIALLIAAVIGLFAGLRKNLHPDFDSVSDLLQGLEAGVNDPVFIGFAIWFLTRLKARCKRRRALRSPHGLRSLAHLVDMHQLTKHPDRVSGRGVADTESSPKRVMTPYELTRYLDCCSEALTQRIQLTDSFLAASVSTNFLRRCPLPRLHRSSPGGQ
jgi:hypothetical protein